MNDYWKEKFKIFKNEFVSVPATLLFLVMVSYGLLIPWMGFYWDDLPFVWFRHFFGPLEFITAFQPYRPLLGYFFAATTALFGEDPLTWQILGLIVRFLLGLEVWLLLRKVWPRHGQSVLWVALLFTVYPAYQQQWVAFTHINQELIPFLFLLGSFLITAWSIRQGRSTVFVTISALILQAVGLFSTEYFFGLEILRFLFLIVIMEDLFPDRRSLLKRSFLAWLPHLIVWIISAGWTYAYHRSSAYASYQVDIPAALSIMELINEFLSTVSLSAFTAWLGTFNLFAVVDGSITQIIAFVLLFVVAAVVFWMMRGNGQPVDLTKEDDSFARWAVIIGIVGIFAGRLPSWAAGLPLMIVFDYDRFFISIMLGASLLIVGLADLLLRNGRGKLLILSMLIGMSAASQFFTANTFRRDWANQQEFFWQMAWRMPALQPGTALLTSDLPLKFASDLQLTAPLNWMYVPDLDQRDLPYAMLHLRTRFTLPEIKADQPISLPYRTVRFDGNTSQVVVIYKEADGCLRVLDPLYNNAATVPGANPYLVSAIPLSKPELIQADAPLPAMNEMLFGSEPSHGWCYFYEKAEISRLNGNWDEVADLFRRAQKEELYPALPVEYLPFIEAFAQIGDHEMAFKLTDRVIKEQKLMCPALLALWERNSANREMPIEIITLLQKGCASSNFNLQTKTE
jgi:hypothetical protein